MRGPAYKTTKYLFTGFNLVHNDEPVPESEVNTKLYTCMQTHNGSWG